MDDIRRIKGLRSILNKTRSEAELIRLDISKKKRELGAKDKEVKRLLKKIKEIGQKSDSMVSEHAIVRYFERVKGYNIEEIEKEIMSDKIKGFIETLGGSGTFPNEAGYSVLMKNNTVTTII